MATICSKCGKMVSQIKRRHRCRFKVETEVETKEYVTALSLHMRLTFDFDTSGRN